MIVLEPRLAESSVSSHGSPEDWTASGTARTMYHIRVGAGKLVARRLGFRNRPHPRLRSTLSISYAIAPLASWIVAGLIKTVTSSVKSGQLHIDMLGYGGLPSTHATIVCTTATLIGIREGATTPAFAVATTLAVLVMMDAVSLRQWVGEQATALNLLRAGDPDLLRLRERVGHKPIEIVAGLVLGIACGFVLSCVG